MIVSPRLICIFSGDLYCKMLSGCLAGTGGSGVGSSLLLAGRCSGCQQESMLGGGSTDLCEGAQTHGDHSQPKFIPILPATLPKDWRGVADRRLVVSFVMKSPAPILGRN